MSTILVDDTDTALLTYAGRWTLGGSSSEYNSTTHGTSTKGSTVTFRFRGTSIAVFGTITASTAKDPQTVSTYKIDQASAVTYTAPVVAAAHYHQELFQSPVLEDGVHTLVITATAANAPTFWLDYLTYSVASGASSSVPVSTLSSVTPHSLSASSSRPPASSTPVTSSAPSSSLSSESSTLSSVSSTLSSASVLPSINSTSSVTPTSAAVTTTTSGSGPNTGLLVAAIVTPILLFLLLGLGFLWRRKQRWRRSEKHVLLDDTSANSPLPEAAKNISPFTSYPAPPAYSDPTSYSAPTSLAEHPLRVAARDGKSASQLLVANPSVTTFTQHADGGVRLDEGQDSVEVPPVYGRY